MPRVAVATGAGARVVAGPVRVSMASPEAFMETQGIFDIAAAQWQERLAWGTARSMESLRWRA